MAKFVLRDCRVEINGVNLSDNVESVAVSQTKAEAPTTNMTSVGQERIAGLSDDNFEVTLQQDFAGSDVDSVLRPLYAGGTTFTIKVRVNSGAISTNNPSYEGTCVLLAYPPLSGDVGALAKVALTFPVNGQIATVIA